EGGEDAGEEAADEQGGDEVQGHRRGQKWVPVKAFPPRVPSAGPGVQGPLLLLRSRDAELREGRIDPVRREVEFVAQHAANAVRIRLAEGDLDTIEDVREEEDLAPLVLRLDVDAEFGQGAFEGAVLLDQRERLLRPDALYTVVEIRADQEAHVHELLARHPEIRERRLERNFLGVDLDVHLLPRQLPAAADRQILHEP